MNKFFIQQDNKGFTLIELMLAMSLFTFVMIIATVGFVGINRTFTKGVARKQLSESVQRLTDDMTKTILNGGAFSSVAMDETNNEKLCNVSTCYVWRPYTASSNKNETFGLVKRPNDGTSKIDGEVLVDKRYKIDYLRVNNIDGTNLYRVTGIIRSADVSAFNLADSSKYPTDNQDISCKGSAQANVSTNCALEKFSFVIRVGAGD